MRTPTSEEILAVHEELASLVSSGLPLGSNLRLLAQDLPGRLRPQVEELARRIGQGESVSQALTASGLAGNAAYAAVFATALRSRQPAKALQSVIATGQRAMNFQQSLGIDFIYPFVVLSVGIGLVTFSLLKTFPVFAKFGDQFQVNSAIVPLVGKIYQWGLDWELLGALLSFGAFVALFGVVWQANYANLRKRFFWRPFGRLRRLTSQGLLCDTLAMLVENEIPLPAAVRLTGDTLAGNELQPILYRASEGLGQGERSLGPMPPLSPFVIWVLETYQGQAMADELRRESERLQREGERLRRWYELYLPMIVTLVIGLSFMFALALIHWGPVIEMYFRLARYDAG